MSLLPARHLLAAGFLFIVAAATVGHPANARPLYVSPVPGALHVLSGTNVIVRPSGLVDEAALRADGALLVTGSISGSIAGRLRLANDFRTILFQPDRPFVPGESVTCRLAGAIEVAPSDGGDPFEFGFTIAGPERDALSTMPAPPDFEEGADLSSLFAAASGQSAVLDSLPLDFTVATATSLGPTAPGDIFLSNLYQTDRSAPAYLLQLRNDGSPTFYRKLPGGSLDFTMQPNGWLTYFDQAAGCFYALDHTYTVVDSFRTGNGYVTDPHDLQLLPNGHALVMAYDPQIVDMTAIDPKARFDATVIGLVIQELDESKNVVFQWRSWDHFRISDAVGILFGASVVDYVHGNSVAATPDGNLLISSRHLEEVTKISRETGQILWRLGGKNNQFQFVGDPVPFSRQHDARVLPNGNLTLFDNGTLNMPRVSRALEYQINERRMTATLVWSYRHDPDIFSPAMGSVQRLPNGNTAIGWGYRGPAYSEVTPDGRLVQEVALREGVLSYRARRFEWPRPLPALVELSPRTLNLGSGGTVAATIESLEFPAAEIDIASVRLYGSIGPEPSTVNNGDANGDGVPDMTLRFNRAAVLALLQPGANVLDLSGSLKSGGRFRGYTNVQVVEASPSRPTTSFVRILSRPGTLPVSLAIEETAGTRSARSTTGTVIVLFDALGRLAARRSAPKGVRRIAWDGRGNDGRPVAAGIYFALVEGSPGGARKIVIVR
jgi:hypothetical protein